MREIKFRAWDDENEKMINVARFDFADYTVYSHLFACEGYLGEALNVMQYTGLKDKNGLEIYEGDLVEFYDFWDEISGGHAEGKSRVGKVGYIGTGFFVTDIKDEEYESDLFLLKINDDALKVIGNIYENKNLLEEK